MNAILEKPIRDSYDIGAARALRENIRVDFPIDINGRSTRFKFIPATKALATPTSFATDDYAIHASVVFIPQGWGVGTKRFWMVMTPFSVAAVGGSAGVEFPEIIASDDGDTWAVPTGLTNPIDHSEVAGEFMPDPNLVFDPAGNAGKGRLYCYYEHSTATTNYLYCKHSDDGVVWSARHVLLSGAAGATGLTSPSVINLRGTWYMFNLLTGTPDGMTVRTSSGGPLGPWGSATSCTLNGLAAGQTYWHGQVHAVGDKFILLAPLKSAYANSLFFGYSEDGVTWKFSAHTPGATLRNAAIYQGTTGAWDADSIYTTSLVWKPTTRSFDVFYSAITAANNGAIGRGALLLLPNAEYNLSPIDQSLAIMGDVIGFWPMLEGSGTTSYDYSRRGHHATSSENMGAWDTSPLYLGPVYALKPNGTDEWLSVADHADFSFGNGSTDLPFSVCAWVYPTSAPANNTLLAKYNSGNSNREWWFTVGSGVPTFALWDQSASGSLQKVGNNNLALNKWHFIVATYDGTAAHTGTHLYIDGVEETAVTTSGANYTAMESLAAPLTFDYLTLGSGVSWQAIHLNTLKAICSRCLTASDVWQLYQIQRRLVGKIGG